MFVVSIVHAIVALLLAAYGANALLLTLLYLWRRRGPTRPLPPMPEHWPSVTVQLPIYNELHVVERLLQAVARFDYPRDQLEIQVLDDSTDETTALAAACVQRLREQGVNAHLLHRAERPGFKAGALAAGLARANGEYIAIFDADFVPPPDFLQRTLPYFMADRRLGFLQTRWTHLNDSYSLLTRAQALALDGHFVVEQTVRQRSGWFFGFNGTAGIWRRSCIIDAGGWHTDTLCEDLDLSYRAQLRGWRGLYLPDVIAPAEIPPQLVAFKRQQARWATGSIQVLRKLSGRILHAHVGWPVKLEALLHVGAYFCHPLLVALLLLTLPLVWLGDGGQSPLQWVLPYVGLASAGPPLLYVVAQWELYRHRSGADGWLPRLLALPVLILLGTGIAVSNTGAVLGGLSNRPMAFRRTPKFRLESHRDHWADKSYALPLNATVLGELFMAAYALLTIIVALLKGQTYAVPLLLLYVLGFVLVASVGWLQDRERWRRQQRPGLIGSHSPRHAYAE